MRGGGHPQPICRFAQLSGWQSCAPSSSHSGMSATPGSVRRTSASPECSGAPACSRSGFSPHVPAPLPPLPPAATPTPAGITPITCPRDFAAHNALTEWWYVTGHLQAEDGRHFGFEFTIFQLRRENSPTGVLAQFAV